MSKILVADDDPGVRELCRMILMTEGFEVLEAGDAASALATANDAGPDLVLMDWMMPGVDGVDALRALKTVPRTREIPVIMLTALDGVSNVMVATQAGADGYMTKPFEADDLISVVRRFTTVPGALAGAPPQAG